MNIPLPPHVEENEKLVQQLDYIATELLRDEQLYKLREKWKIPNHGVVTYEQLMLHNKHLTSLSRVIRSKKPSPTPPIMTDTLRKLLALDEAVGQGPALELFHHDISMLAKKYKYPEYWFSFYKTYVVFGQIAHYGTQKMTVGNKIDARTNLRWVYCTLGAQLRYREFVSIWTKQVKQHCMEILTSNTDHEQAVVVLKEDKRPHGSVVIALRINRYIPISDARAIWKEQIYPLLKKLPNYNKYNRPSKPEIVHRNAEIANQIRLGSSYDNIAKALATQYERSKGAEEHLNKSKGEIQSIYNKHLKSIKK